MSEQVQTRNIYRAWSRTLVLLARGLIQLLHERPHLALLWASIKPGGPMFRGRLKVTGVLVPRPEPPEHPGQSRIPAALIQLTNQRGVSRRLTHQLPQVRLLCWRNRGGSEGDPLLCWQNRGGSEGDPLLDRTSWTLPLL